MVEPLDLRGQFWQAGHTDTPVAGRFHVDAARLSKLEVYGALSTIKRMLNAGQVRILGRLENGKLITLENCFITRHRWSSVGDATGTLHVNMALVGHHFEAGEDIALSAIRFHADIVDEWLSFAPIKVDHPEGSDGTTIVFEPPAERSWTLANGTTVQLHVSWSGPSFPTRRKAEISTQTYLQLANSPTRSTINYVNFLRRRCQPNMPNGLTE
jgi:hypothetical protein